METTGTSIAVVYDEGVFKPQEPVPASVKPHQILQLPVPEESPAAVAAHDDDEATGWNNLMELVGILNDKDGATDVSTNHDKYLYGGR